MKKGPFELNAKWDFLVFGNFFLANTQENLSVDTLVRNNFSI
jgi:hypothetical protein